jgi:phage host-nuclease inhibitor protein Gam
MKRIKSTGPVIKSRDELESVVGEICQRTIKRDELKAQMDGYLKEVRERYETQFAYIDNRLEELTALARQWAEANPETFRPAKSLVLTHGLIGWRTGMPRLKTMAGWNWDMVKEYCRVSLPQYVRLKEEVNREQILADRELLGKTMSQLGVKVVQDETFFVEPTRTPATEQRQTA